MTWTELDEPIVVVPVGSCEQHGPHLPVNTDTVVADYLARDLAARRDDCVVAPPIAISASGEHAGFPGTLSIGTDVMAEVLIEVARSADWAGGVVFVNGHGGNVAAMKRASASFDRDDRKVLLWWPRLPDGDLHAGHTETSMMLAIAPESVRVDRSEAGPTPPMADLVRHGVKELSPNGVLGDPSAANAEEGAKIFRHLADDLADAVEDWLR